MEFPKFPFVYTAGMHVHFLLFVQWQLALSRRHTSGSASQIFAKYVYIPVYMLE